MSDHQGSEPRGFALRHRGVHVPDHLRRLEVLTSQAPSSPARRFPATATAPATLPGREHTPGDEDLVALFANFSVWMDNALRRSTQHAGFDKIHLHLLFFRCLVEELAPNTMLLEAIESLTNYAAHLSNEMAMLNPRLAPKGNSPRPPIRPNKVATSLNPMTASTRPTALREVGMLSPRMLKVMTIPTSKDQPSPGPLASKGKKIIELSDHEEAILGVALLFDEVVIQMGSGSAAKSKPDAVLTEEWLQLSTQRRAKELKKIKQRLAKNVFFADASAEAMSMSVGRMGSARSFTFKTSVAHPHKMWCSDYFELLVVCLHEAFRSIRVFSADASTFASHELMDTILSESEKVYDEIISKHKQSQEELETLRRSRKEIQELIEFHEQEIHRLQTQNIKSLNLWEVETQETKMLEHEEQWHGHCKALILQNLANLSRGVQFPTWLQLSQSRNDPTGMEIKETTQDSAHETASTPTANYQQVPPGGALLHYRFRCRVLYVAHLMVLCRSFLHLNEKRQLEDVLLSTMTNRVVGQAVSEISSSVLPSLIDIGAIPGTPLLGNQIERITTSELHTLREINNVLRSIDVLYAETGASGCDERDEFTASARLHHKDTQFPGDASTNGQFGTDNFLRSLSYCTIAVTSMSATSTFVHPGKSMRFAKTSPNGDPSLNVPIGSGRRRGSAKGLDMVAIQSPLQQHIRLSRAFTKLPKHIKECLLLPLIDEDPFPIRDSRTSVALLTKDEIIDRIHWIYNSVLDSAFLTGSSHSHYDPAVTLLSTESSTTWRTEDFVEFIHGCFVESLNEVRVGENEFIRFFASIQLMYSSVGNTGGPGSASSVSGISESIHFFTLMTRLYSTEDCDTCLHPRLPSRAFSIFFYSLRVLQHVSMVKKFIDEGGMAMDIWVLPTHEEAGIAARRKRNGGPIVPQSRFVLLECVKTLLVYLLEGTSPDSSNILDERVAFLSEKATLATVSVLSPTAPGPYSLNPGTGNSASGSTNGELVETRILPMEFAVHTIVNVWIEQHKSLVRRLSIGFRAGNIGDHGGIYFDEFCHVMNVGSVNPFITTKQLARMYSSVLGQGRKSVHWKELVSKLSNDCDFLCTNERLTNVDFRSIQLALLRRSHSSTSPWTASPIYRTGDTIALQKTWEHNHPVMAENFSLAFQADNILEGIAVSESGNSRMRIIERFIAGRSSPYMERTTDMPEGQEVQTKDGPRRQAVNPAQLLTDLHELNEMTQEELDVAWRAWYYLHVDNIQAHYLADQVRIREHKQPLAGQAMGISIFGGNRRPVEATSPRRPV